MTGSDDELIDRIYETAIVRELWPGVLNEIAEQVGSVGGALFDVQPGGMRWVGSDVMSGLLGDFAALGKPELNIRTPFGLKTTHAGFITEHDFLTDEQLDSHPFYTEFLRPRGFGWCAGTAIKTPTGDRLVYTFERRYRDGPFDREKVRKLDLLRPHLARAAVLSGRLALERARAAAEMLKILGLPGAVLSHSHRISAANSLLEDLVPDVVRDGSRRMAFADPEADALLAAAIEHRDRRTVRSIPIAADRDRPPMIAHLVPILLAARDVFSAASDVLVITPVAHPEAPAADIIQGLFDLTPAESRVARGIAMGETIQALAARSGLSPATVRTQLKSVFLKTGLSRQADLVGLLAGLYVPGPREELPD
ncbi:helix-turn-helix transcriptional regulator [Aurantimonas sp. HBX-1]|uniref:helix-turn-helix transcriptional regulator n=1 Tax=Aurantimonas sp. HBX-1 TaxID=2906072 RepID=UPI001F3BB316|nr:helix-turn-helix transcriptional regulator [Aurantimonas sp. HBX-1]UIJ70701.1 helix-turn-helix transcriptional regulator [Aurantimonas sp. HBX-1]